MLWVVVIWLFLNGKTWAEDSSPYYKQPLTSPAQIQSSNGEIEATISIDYNFTPKNNSVWKSYIPKNSAPNAPSTIGPDVVALRNYTVQNVKQGSFTLKGVTAPTPASGTNTTWITNLIGPTLRVQPGDTITLHLINNLPDDRATGYGTTKVSCIGDIAVSKASCNMTNFHTHGLHDSPETVAKIPGDRKNIKETDYWIGDDVIDSLLPGGNQWDIKIKIPENHPAGTFWYHPHQHGTTSVQLASGMEGAIIIDDKSSAGSKTLDQILGDARITTDRLLMLQHLPYESTDGKSSCATSTPCEVGWTEQGSKDANFSGHIFTGYTLVNGQTYPQINMTTNAIERWRLINGGVAEAVSLSIVQLSDAGIKGLSSQLDALTAPNRKPFNKGNRIGIDKKNNIVSKLKTWLTTNSNFATNNKGAIASIPLNIFAYDGITTGRIESPKCDKKGGGGSLDNCVTLAPGNRVDALIQPPKAGTYLLVKGINSAYLEENGAKIAEDIVAVLTVTGNNTETSLPAESDLLAYASQQFYPPMPALANKSLTTLNYEAHFLFYPKRGGEVPGNKKDAHNIHNITFGMAFGMRLGSHSDPNAPSDLDYEQFTENMKPILLTKGQLGEWTIKVEDDGEIQSAHPFHIHTNPFYLMEIKTCTKKVTSKPSAAVPYTAKYTDCKSTKPMRWQDTLLVLPDQIATFRYQPLDFEGSFVFHCHFVDHEDSGMMRWVKICDENNKDCRTKDKYGLLPDFTRQDL